MNRSLTDRIPVGDLPVGVSPICLMGVEDASLVRAAYEMGINFFGLTTDLHWARHEATRRGLCDLIRDVPAARDDIVLMAVSYMANPSLCHAPFSELLESAPTLGRLDISAMGSVQNHDFLVRLAEHEKHRATGSYGVGAIGAQIAEEVAARFAISHDMIDIAFLGYRPAATRIRTEVLDGISERGRSIPVFSSHPAAKAPGAARLDELGLGPDKWRPEKGDYIRYAMTHAATSGVLCSVINSKDLRAIDEAIRGGPLDEEDIAYLDDLADLDIGLAELDHHRTNT